MKIFYDIDTQNDFMNANGALYVPGAEDIKNNIKMLIDTACNNDIQIVGSVDKHFGLEEFRGREHELRKNGGIFYEHCMTNSFGQEKIRQTNVREKNIFHCNYVDGYVNEEILEKAINFKLHLYFEKQSYNVFTNKAIEFFIDKYNIDEVFMFGVATDWCVKAAALQMRQKGIKVYIIEDAIAGVSEDTSNDAINLMKDNGCIFISTNKALEMNS